MGAEREMFSLIGTYSKQDVAEPKRMVMKAFTSSMAKQSIRFRQTIKPAIKTDDSNKLGQ